LEWRTSLRHLLSVKTTIVVKNKCASGPWNSCNTNNTFHDTPNRRRSSWPRWPLVPGVPHGSRIGDQTEYDKYVVKLCPEIGALSRQLIYSTASTFVEKSSAVCRLRFILGSGGMIFCLRVLIIATAKRARRLHEPGRIWTVRSKTRRDLGNHVLSPAPLNSMFD
jgi:hypothetical protein